MYCTECGEKLSLVFRDDEGLVPYCNKCQEYRFPQYNMAVSMVVTNREKNKILLAKHKDDDDYILFAGYIKKGEIPEKTVTREFKEETKLNVVKYKYMSSKYVESKNVLMLNYVVMAENGESQPNLNELKETTWFTFEEALQNIRPGSTAEIFLKNAVAELNRGAVL